MLHCPSLSSVQVEGGAILTQALLTITIPLWPRGLPVDGGSHVLDVAGRTILVAPRTTLPAATAAPAASGSCACGLCACARVLRGSGCKMVSVAVAVVGV